jgi:hypothetical protein
MAGEKDPVSTIEELRLAERRFARLLDALRADAALAASVREFETKRGAEKGREFGSNALKVNGKLFALFAQGTMVVKLPSDRVDALVAQGVGQRFDTGHGRLMKGWLALEQPCTTWVQLAREALAYVGKSTR